MQKTIILDFDETLVHMIEAWCSAWQRVTGRPLYAPRAYDFSDQLSCQEDLALLHQVRTPDLYHSYKITPVAGAQQLVNWLRQRGWNIVAATNDTPQFVPIKQELLERWFDAELAGSLTLTKDKWASVPDASILIDDNPAMRPSVYPAQPYNTGFAPRVNNLMQVPVVLGLS